MKKQQLPLGVTLGFAAGEHAQLSVVMRGIIASALRHGTNEDDNGDRLVSEGDRAVPGRRFGFSFIEDLAGGMRAIGALKVGQYRFRGVARDVNASSVRGASLWMRAPEPEKGNAARHETTFAYGADSGLPLTAPQPYGIARYDARLQNASLDHSTWFHRPFRTDDWLLVGRDSSCACGGHEISFPSANDRQGSFAEIICKDNLIYLQ